MSAETQTVAPTEQAQALPLSKRMRAAIAVGHDQAEETKLAKAIAASTVSTEDYVALLQQLHHVHETLENELRADHLTPFTNAGQFRLDHLVNDLNHFNAKPNDTQLQATAQLVEQIKQWGQSTALIGALYILEGSRMGSRVLAPRLAQAFGIDALDAGGLDYHTRDREGFFPLFMKFKQLVDQRIQSEADQQQVIDAAVAMMSGMAGIYRELSED